jgi:tRNA1(Val) A37 N6-methylase TrmN6
MRVIYPDNDSNAKLVLMEAWLNANSGLTILPPIFGQGAYSIESQA